MKTTNLEPPISPILDSSNTARAPRRARPGKFGSLLGLIGLIGLMGPGASSARAETIHASPHLDHTTWIVGAKIVQFNAWNPGDGESPNETVNAIGGGLLIERTLLEGWLEIELSVAGVDTDEGTAVPIDLLLKKSFEFGRINPYVGIGPSISVDIVDGEAETSAGCAFAIGTYIWMSDHVGIDVDVDYALVSNRGAAQELTLSLGPVLRF